jgi:beta-galactosidase
MSRPIDRVSRRRLLQGAALGGTLLPLTPLTAQVLDAPSPRFAVGTQHFLLDGQPLQIRCGEMHFARVPREYWRHRLQAIQAMGLNAVCAYLFWNFHEWREGRYDWAAQRDAAAFCRLAQELGLWVILRPGPYACAEWEMGGLPWWLLKKSPSDAFLRTRDPAYVAPARRWMGEVGRELAPLQITRGGPILMVQAENEYGFYGDDLAYMREMRQALLDGQFDVPLFQCNPTNAVAKTHIPELLSVANFGTDPQRGFNALKAVQQGPLMCGEYYSGWFDTWGTPHRKGDAAKAVADLAWILKAGGSFSLYMAHGGTSFGLWGGCDRPFRPDTTSYDYDAPISEAGWTGEKFQAYREGLCPFLPAGETLPPPPPRQPVITIPPFTLKQAAPVLANLPLRRLRVDSPQPIEAYDISRGLVAYRTTLPAGPAGVLEVAKARDLAWVHVDGKPVGSFDTRHRRYRVRLPARAKAVSVDILLYTIARVNFGVEVHDRKGLHGPVSFTPVGGEQQPVTGWDIRAIDFDADAALPPLKFREARPTDATTAAFWRGSFRLDEVGDSFLDLSRWGQGIVWVNGQCLGRYWSIGPTQTLYLPGPWLRRGRNDIVVLDLTGPRRAEITGLTTPILDRLRPELDLPQPAHHARPQLDGVTPVLDGEFAPGGATQVLRFAAPATGRFFALEVPDQDMAAIAEIALLDAADKPLNQSNWTIAYVSSEERLSTDGSALNAINGQNSDCWISAHSQAPAAPPPHRLIVDMSRSVEVAALRYTPRQGPDSVAGRIRRYRAYLGDGLLNRPD